MKLVHIKACLVLLTAAACGTKAVTDQPVASDAGDATDTFDATADVTCYPVSDTACCLNGVLSGNPCVLDGKVTCPGGGVACSTMGGSNSCTVKCGADLADDTADVPDVADTADVQEVGPVDCAKLVADWAAFVAAHEGCAVDGDCTVAGGAGSCDLASAIGKASGDPIATSALPEAQPMLATFYGPDCMAYRDAHGTWDAAPATNLRCASGHCTADWASCNAAPDIAQPDANGD